MVGFRVEKGKPATMEPAIGFIDIIVESNVNRVIFTYALSETSLSETRATLSGNNDDSSTARIIVPVKNFRCSNQFVYKDFLTLLKASQYPNLTINIPQKVLLQYSTSDSVIIRGVMINIAGVSKRYNITCNIENLNKKDFILLGTTTISLTDLEIEPPVKYFRLIKIKDKVIIKFGFCLKDSNVEFNKI